MKRIDWLSIVAFGLVVLYFVDWFVTELAQ